MIGLPFRVAPVLLCALSTQGSRGWGTGRRVSVFFSPVQVFQKLTHLLSAKHAAGHQEPEEKVAGDSKDIISS